MEISEKMQSFCIALLIVQMQVWKNDCNFNALSLLQGQNISKFKTSDKFVENNT